MDSAIVKLIQHYYPAWREPQDTGYEWISCLCPWHGDTNKSASVSLTKNAFHCFVCDAKGDVINLIRYEEGCGYGEAFRRAEELLKGSYVAVSRGPARKSRRRIFADEGIGLGVDQTSSEPFPTRIRW